MGHKLLIITQAVDPADSALGFFCEWLENFSKYATAIEVWCLREGEWKEKPANICVRVFPKRRRSFEFIKRLLADKSEAVFVHMSPIWAVLGGWWWRLKGKRVALWYTHGQASTMLAWAIKFANIIFTATPEAFPIASDKVRAIGHGVGRAFGSIVRTKSAGGLRLLSVGRVTARKRVRESLEFFSQIKKVEPGAKYVWIGEALTDQDIKYQSELQADESAVFTGKVLYADLPRYFANADLLIHLSGTGSLDKVVIEALGAGCPVFSSNRATAEIFPEAFWSGELDENATRKAIELAKNGIAPEQRKEISEKFSLEKLIGKIVSELLS